MRRKLFTLVWHLAALAASAGIAAATPLDCRVQALKDRLVVLDCDENAGRVAPGEQVILRPRENTKQEAVPGSVCGPMEPGR